jgi:beta-galactosidase GanA
LLDDTLMASAAKWMMRDSSAKPASISVPEGVEVSRRSGDAGDVFVLINYTRVSQRVALPHSMQLLLAQKRAEAVDLPAYGVEVLVESR